MLRSEPKLAALVDDTYVYSQRLITPSERGALAAMLPAYDAAMIPATESEINRMIGKLALGYPSAKVSDEEADARLELYAAALSDVPADILGRACMAALRTRTFFPSVAEIRQGCGEMVQRQWRASRIRYLIAVHDRDWKEPEPDIPLTPAEEAELDASLRKLGIVREVTETPRELAA